MTSRQTHPVNDFMMGLVFTMQRRADLIEEAGFSSEADQLRRTLGWIRGMATAWSEEQLTLDEAVHLSGLSYSTVQALVVQGKIENVGQKGSPRIRHGDLPWRPQSPDIEDRVETIHVGGPPRARSAHKLVEDELLDMEGHHDWMTIDQALDEPDRG